MTRTSSSPRRPSWTWLTPLLSVIAVVGALSACGDAATGVSASPAPNSSEVDASSAPGGSEGPASLDREPSDASIAATCAAFSAVDSIVGNARHRLDTGEITEEEYAVVLRTASYGFMTLRGEETQRGLGGKFDAMLRDLGGSTAVADGALDPRNDVYVKASDPIHQACQENGSVIAIFAAGG